jgi:hypothetical protein
MGYVLRKLGAGSNLEITQAEYEAIKNAKAMYVQLISVEQNFDAVIEDYVELENTISNYAVRYLAFHLMDESDAFDAVQGTISRRIVHVLATARLYRDALRQHGKAVLKADGTFQQIETALKDAPDQPMSFRIVEALRNYSQHSALPISSMMAGSQWESSETERQDRAAYFIVPRIDAIKVSRDRKLATDVRAELTKLGEEAEIIGHIRRYIEHLGSIHSTFRKLTAAREKQWAGDHEGRDGALQAGDQRWRKDYCCPCPANGWQVARRRNSVVRRIF